MLRISLLLVMALVSISCTEKNPLSYDPTTDPDVVSVAYLKSLYKTEPVKITADVSISGVVICDDSYRNLVKMIYIEDATGGICVRIDCANIYRKLWTGAEVRVSCNGLTLGSYGGEIMLGATPTGSYESDYIAENDITKHVSVLNPSQQTPRPTNLTFVELKPRHVGCLVRFEGVQFVGEELPLNWCDDDPEEPTQKIATSRHIINSLSDTLHVFTHGSAQFAGLRLPQGSGSMVGVLSYFNGKYELRVADYTFVEMSGYRFSFFT